MFQFAVQSPPQELYSKVLAASVLTLPAQTENISTHERETPFDNTIAETVRKANENVVDLKVKATPLPSSSEAVRNSATIATSADDNTVLTNDDLENTTAAFKKQNFSKDETLPEYNCKQLKNRESVSVLGWVYTSGKKNYFNIELTRSCCLFLFAFQYILSFVIGSKFYACFIQLEGLYYHLPRI